MNATLATIINQDIRKRDIPTLTLPTVTSPTISSASETSTSYAYSIDVQNDSNNPYIARTALPENLVFIIFGGLIGLILSSFISFYLILWLRSLHYAKHEGEKYYYNQSLIFGSASLSSSSVWEQKSANSTISQMTLNQQLFGRNRGSMFFSPTDNFWDYSLQKTLDYKSSSPMSLFELNGSNLEIGNITSDKSLNINLTPRRPPSKYLEDLLGDDPM